MIGMKAANLQVLNTPKPLPVSKESVAGSTKMLFTELCPRLVIISQYTDETASENTHSACDEEKMVSTQYQPGAHLGQNTQNNRNNELRMC